MTDTNTETKNEDTIMLVVKKTYTVPRKQALGIPLLKNIIEDDMYDNRVLELPRGYDVLEHVLNGREVIIEDDKKLEQVRQEFSYFGLETDKLIDDYNTKKSLIIKLKKMREKHSKLHKHLEKSSLDDIKLIYKLLGLIIAKTPKKRTKSTIKPSWNSIQPRN